MTRNRARSRRSVIALKNVVISSVVRYLGAPGVLFLFKGPNRMAILFGNSRFCAVFANVFVVGHVGNCAVVCVWQP